VGPANVDGAPDDAFLLRIPNFQLGSLRVKSVVAASRPNETYSATSFETPAPIVGALGGNVLREFRVEIDYPDQLLFLEPAAAGQASGFDTVGLVLTTNAAGQLVVRAISTSASPATRQNILPDDIIVQMDSSSRAPFTLTEAAEALSGVVGDRKLLRILRHGKPMSIAVVVSRIL
jgi:S1-C subfamily serine protease